MALAVGAKLTAAFIPLSAMVYIFMRAQPRLVPLVLGGAVGSLPILYYAATAFDKFLYGNVVFHLTAHIEYYADTASRSPYMAHRVKSVVLIWFSEPTLVVATLFVAFVVFIGWRRGLLFWTIGKHLLADRIFIILLMIVAIPFVFLPNPFGWPYLAAYGAVCIAQLRGAISAGENNFGASADARFRCDGYRRARIAD